MGMSISEFERIWPKEFFLYVQGYNERKEEEAKEKIVQAYLTAQWTHQFIFGKRKPPSLDKILNQTTNTKKQMTVEDMLAEVKRLNAMFGGKIKYESPDKKGGE